MHEVASLPIAVVLVVGVIAGVVDAWKYRVHNMLTLPLLITGLVYGAYADGMAGLTSSVCGALVGLAVLSIPYMMGGIGGGDVKLMAGIGAWLGVPATLWVFAAAGIAAGLYSLFILIVFGGFRRVLLEGKIAYHVLRAMCGHLGPQERVEQVVREPDRRRRLIPFATMIALGISALVVWHCFLMPGAILTPR